MRKQQIQTQKQVSAYSRQITHRLLYDVVEFLEKYIEIAGYYPDWEQRKQIKDNGVVRPISGPEDAEKCFSVVLLGFVGTMKSKPDFIREEIKKEFYEWVDATGIDVNNCHPRLKHCLFGISEVIEGRGEKIIADVINSKRTLTPGTPEYSKELGNVFSKIQDPLNNEREIELSLKGKTYKDIEVESRFKGSSDRGQKTFERITKDHNYQDFHFFPQETQQSHPVNAVEVVREVKTNPQNWMLDEVATEINRLGWVKKQEPAVYCRHARLDDYNQEGKLNFNNNPIYLWENFNSQQRFEVKKAKNISGDYLTNEEIKWVIREFKENPKVWRIGMDKGQTYLIHNSAQGKDKIEFGTLIHNQQKFNREEWAEINGTLERISIANQTIRWEVVNRIKQQESRFKVEKVVVLNEKISDYDEEWWIIHDLAERKDNGMGGLVFDSENMFKVKDLTEAEKKEIGYNKSEASLQNSVVSTIPKKNDDNSVSTGKVLSIIGVISAVVIASVVVLRKKLNKKIRG